MFTIRIFVICTYFYLPYIECNVHVINGIFNTGNLKLHHSVIWQKQTLMTYTVSQKNDNDVLRYNFNAHQPILIIFGRDIAEWICY